MPPNKKHPSPLSLKFSVTGKPVVSMKLIDTNQALRIFIKKALEESGSARPMNDYDVVFKSIKLDINQKTGSFNFPANAVIMVSLKTAQGANNDLLCDSEWFDGANSTGICLNNHFSTCKPEKR